MCSYKHLTSFYSKWLGEILYRAVNMYLYLQADEVRIWIDNEKLLYASGIEKENA